MRLRHPLASLWADGVLPFAVLLVIVFVMLTSGCAAYGPAKQSSNTLRTALHEVAPLLQARCVDPYEGAETMTPDEAAAKLKEYDRSGCSRMIRAYEVARVSHVALVATVGAHEIGACANSRLRECDIPRALLEAGKAAVAIKEVVAVLRGGK